MFDDGYSLWLEAAFVPYRRIGWVGRLSNKSRFHGSYEMVQIQAD